MTPKYIMGIIIMATIAILIFIKEYHMNISKEESEDYIDLTLNATQIQEKNINLERLINNVHYLFIISSKKQLFFMIRHINYH